MPSGIEVTLDETLVATFNLGFRRGANDRHRAGLPLEGSHEPSGSLPETDRGSERETRVWQQGYLLGYSVGASDEELASVPEPGAVGMIREIGPEMLAMLQGFGDP